MFISISAWYGIFQLKQVRIAWRYNSINIETRGIKQLFVRIFYIHGWRVTTTWYRSAIFWKEPVRLSLSNQIYV